ncbi:MAG: WG repeat-containing protein [Sediminibacterium sp.]|nr:WG repeat-containing protein [Sediminibacterium sp.]
MKYIIASAFLIFLNQSYAQSVVEDTSFNILNYLENKYPKIYKQRNDKIISYLNECKCNVAALTHGNYYYQEVKNIQEEIIGYNILGVFIPEGDSHDGLYGKRIIDPHFISSENKQIISELFFLQNQINYRHTVLIKPEIEMGHSMRDISYSIKTITVVGNYNQNQDSILFVLDNTYRDESSKIINIELLNQDIENLDTTKITFIFTTNSSSASKGIVNSSGEIIFESIFSEIKFLKRKKEIDFFLVKKNNRDDLGDWGEKFGIAMSNGNYVFEPNFSVLETDGNNLEQFGFGKMKYKRKFGLIDAQYNMIVEPIYDEFIFINSNKKYAIIKKQNNYHQNEKMWDFFNINTKKELGLNLQEIRNIEDAEIVIKRNNLWGFCNQSGQIIIQPKYSFVTSFKEGLAFAVIGHNNNRENNSYFLINKVGATVATLNKSLGDDMAIVDSVSEGMILFKSRKTNLHGFINKKGVLVIPPTFENAEPYYDGKSYVRKFGTSFYIDKNGNRIKE